MEERSNARRGRRGLRKLLPELIAQAQDQTAATITRIMLTFVGVAIFCLLSLLTPDVALLTGGERLNVPFAGPVSFLGFIVVGPAVLIALRVYLQIYIEHWRRLEPIRRRLQAPSVPTLVPLRNPLLRSFAGFVLFLLLPLTMLAFTWKAAMLHVWGSVLLCVTVAVATSHLVLFPRWSWRARALLTAGTTILVATAVYGAGPLSRPANLFRADLSNQWLPASHLESANLRFANLAGANLASADLEGANLEGADLADARLENADLAGANLESANLEGADFGFMPNLAGVDLEWAKVPGASLVAAHLAGANLRFANLAGANLISPTSSPPISSLPISRAPLSRAPGSGAPTSRSPISRAPISWAPSSGAPTSWAPTSWAPTSGAPTSGAPTSWAPISRALSSSMQ
jgi:hypothetical protein